MGNMPVLKDLDASSVATLPCCGAKNAAHEGRRQKNCWLGTYFEKGLRAKVLLTPDNRQCGYIEYLPGEYAWRGVEAGGYMFIHCLWTHLRQYQKKGLAGMMVEACVEDARKAGMNGVAVLTRESPWLAGSAVFLKNGFEVIDTAPPDYELLVRKLKRSVPNPVFKAGWEKKLKKYGEGLTLIRSRQCPYGVKFAQEIAESAETDFVITPRIVELKTHREAQNAPTPYAVFALIYKGRVLADHQISRTRFRNIMRRELSPGARH